MIPIEPIDKQGGEHCNDGHAVVVDADEIDLPAVPAEGEEEFHAPVHVDEEEIQDEMRPDTDAEWEEGFLGSWKHTAMIPATSNAPMGVWSGSKN